MRPIKYRAWHKDLKLMREVTRICFDHNEVIVTDSENNRYTWFEGTFELMQFTGLHDRNGNEIFEGDVVKFEDWSPKEVAWLDKIAGYELKGTLLWLSQNDSSKMEIIGSIHENPELLETK